MVNSDDATTCSVSNNTIYGSSKQTPRCSELQTTVGSHVFSTFKPYSYKFGSISGDCCYLENNDSECSKISKNLTEIYTYDCSGCIDEDGDIMNRAKLCGVKPVIFESGNLKALAILILMCFLSTFAYALFAVGPFIFWMKQAPNIPITKPNCYNDMSVLERHYPYEADKLPYNYNILNECNVNKSNTKYPSFDKCPATPGVKSGLDKNNSLSGETTWDMITKPFGGFPYNLLPGRGREKDDSINKKEKKMEAISGTLFVFTWVICLMFFAIMGAPYFDSSPDGHHKGQAVGLTFFIILFYLAVFAGVNLKFLGAFRKEHIEGPPGLQDPKKVEKAKNSVGRAWAMQLVFLVFTLILSIIAGVFFGPDPSKHKYALIIMGILTIGLFSIMSIISYMTNQFTQTEAVNGVIKEKLYNFKFFDVFVKMWYYLKKSFVFSIQEGLIYGRMVPYKVFDTIKEWPIPTPFFIIFGWIPHILFYFVTFVRFCAGGAGGVMGAFGKYKRDQNGKVIGTMPDTLKSGIAMFLFGGIIMAFVNAIFNVCSYHFIPLLYPKFMTQMIKCNIKTFTFVFCLSILAAMWGKHGVAKYNYVPKPVLICMTITFAIITLYNIIMHNK